MPKQLVLELIEKLIALEQINFSDERIIINYYRGGNGHDAIMCLREVVFVNVEKIINFIKYLDNLDNYSCVN